MAGTRPRAQPYSPTNLGYLASYLISKGIAVDIWDFETEWFEAKKFLERLEAVRPRIVGFSCMTPTIINGSKIAGLIKWYFPDIITIIGGSHSSAILEQTLEEFPCFDLVVNREGEETLAEVCDRVLGGQEPTDVMGTTWRMDEHIVKEPTRSLTRELDSLPFSARHLYLGKAPGRVTRRGASPTA